VFPAPARPPSGQLAQRLRWKFIEGDALHPPENVAEMKRGEPLTDSDRAPWLAAVAEAIDGWSRRGEHGVITRSALKRNYCRQIIGDRRDVRLVYLEGSREVIARRMAARRGHFMPPTLLDSQFVTLEPPGPDEKPITVAINQPADEIIGRISGVLLSAAESPAGVRSNLEGIA
jgi:carbohydrate kinase (thermoresistant glucokinase family)